MYMSVQHRAVSAMKEQCREYLANSRASRRKLVSCRSCLFREQTQQQKKIRAKKFISLIKAEEYMFGYGCYHFHWKKTQLQFNVHCLHIQLESFLLTRKQSRESKRKANRAKRDSYFFLSDSYITNVYYLYREYRRWEQLGLSHGNFGYV